MPAHVQNFDGDDGRAGRNAGNDLDDPAGSGGDGAGHFDVSKKMNQHELLDAMQAGNSGPKATAAGLIRNPISGQALYSLVCVFGPQLRVRFGSEGIHVRVLEPLRFCILFGARFESAEQQKSGLRVGHLTKMALHTCAKKKTLDRKKSLI